MTAGVPCRGAQPRKGVIVASAQPRAPADIHAWLLGLTVRRCFGASIAIGAAATGTGTQALLRRRGRRPLHSTAPVVPVTKPLAWDATKLLISSAVPPLGQHGTKPCGQQQRRHGPERARSHHGPEADSVDLIARRFGVRSRCVATYLKYLLVGSLSPSS